MFSGPPQITEHAYDRAQVRLKLNALGLRAWVDATYRDWLPVNASYLRDRDVRVSADGRHHFVVPWTYRESVAVCLSEDMVVITVMTFSTQIDSDLKTAGALPPRPKAIPSVVEQAARRIVNDLGHPGVINLALGRRPGRDLHADLMRDGLEQFANGRRDLKWLQTYWNSNVDRRQEMLAWPDRQLSEAERNLIRPAPSPQVPRPPSQEASQ